MNDEFTPNSDDKLEDVLALLAAGMPLAEVLTEAGDDAAWLRPLLQIANEVSELRATVPVPSPEVSLRRMLDYSQGLAAASPPAVSAPSGWQVILARLFGGGLLPRLATGLVMALLVVALLGGTVTALAQRSLPGQPLYSLKRAGEALRLALTQDPVEHDRLLENYNLRRQMEVPMLLEQGQITEVIFEGRIKALTSTSLILDELLIQLKPETKINGALAVGARIQVKALTQPPDQLIALTVSVIEAALPTPTPTLTSTSTPTSTPSPTATPGLSSATDIPRLPMASPTHTLNPLLPSPTATPKVVVVEPLRTATPPAGGDNDNASDNTNADQGGDDNANGNDDDTNRNEDNVNESMNESEGNDNLNGNDDNANIDDGNANHNTSDTTNGDSGGDDNSGAGGGGGNSGSDGGSSDNGGGNDN